MWQAILSLGGLGMLASLSLGIASKKFAVEVDPKVEAILEALPGANCGACGYPGCSGMAEAMAKGKASITGCPVGGSETVQVIAGILGVEAETRDPIVARLICKGGRKDASEKFRYHGILAPAARYRSRVVPFASAAEPKAREGETGSESQVAGSSLTPIDESSAKPRPRNYSWAELMRRVFEIDVLECPECGNAMRILAAIHPPEASRAILECLGLPSRAPPISPPVFETSADLEAWS